MKTRRGFTLTELLVVLAVTATVISMIGSFFVEGWIAVHRAFRRNDNSQLLPIVMKVWQKSLANTEPASWSVNNTSFNSTPTVVEQEGKHLAVINGDKTQHFLLPNDATCRFSVENSPGLAACAVLDVYWESRYFASCRMNHVRFVACGRRDEKPR